MKVEIREDSVVISGYVNAVERYSKTIREKIDGAIRTFIERIKAGTFKNALKRNDDVKVLLNHNHNRVLASTKDGSAKLEEDNIGLRAEVIITDKEVIEKARNNQLVGWSFGFYKNADEFGTDGSTETRTITDLDLIEVSILDDTKSPAYYGTSIEARSENEKVLEYRATIEEIEENAMEKHKEINEQEEANWEEASKKHKMVDAEKEKAKLEIFAEMVANKVLEKMNGTREEETTPEETLVEVEKVEEEKRSTELDYSEFEKRIANL